MGICHYCDKEDETRPYGPKGENVCFPCAMTPERFEQTNRSCDQQMDAAIKAAGVEGIVVLGGEQGPYVISSKVLN